jgi:isoaspartyl peptidase/L-asparaginase-like protein (Ntn-hydrolase superfamily)
MTYFAIATWKFSLTPVQAALKLLKSGKSSLDAAELIAYLTEDNPTEPSVGFAGWPNLHGEVELDAAIMDGRTMRIGAVAGVKGFRHPVSIARKVLTDTEYNLLVGMGAELFALNKGFKKDILFTESSIADWHRRMKKRKLNDGHDTLGCVCIDRRGNLAASNSTSGLPLKHPGRVGDSPVSGAGFYADNEVGGAAATGVGEEITRSCLSYKTVELIRRGMHPWDAAETAVRSAHRRLRKVRPRVGNMAVICCDRKGIYGAAANHPGFYFTVASDRIKPMLVQVKAVK